MQRTTNYGLCQYEGSDKTSYLVNYNDDMLKIDTAIKAASDDAASAQTKADTADGKADTNAGNISALNTQINGEGGVAADVVTLQGAVNTINSLIGNGEPTTTDKTLIGAINELHSEIMNGYEVVSKHVKVGEVTADGVKTFSQLLGEVHTGIVTYLNALDDDESITIDTFNQTAIGSFINQDIALLTKQSGFGSSMFDRIGAYNGAMRLQVVDLKASNAVFQSTEVVFSDNSVTGNDSSSSVPASGVKFYVMVTRYKALA